MKSDETSILRSARANFDRATSILGDDVEDGLLGKIRDPKERIELTFGPQLDDGRVHVFRAFIVRHSFALGPAKGGIRMTPGVTLDDVTGLAMEMSWKCALIGVPFGGGKSGIQADAERLSKYNKETILRGFVRNAHRHIGPQIYIPAPDMGTNEADMGHIKDTICYSVGEASTKGCYVTGKPVILGGIPGRRIATGRGVALCVAEALKVLEINPDGATAVVQGFGNVGSVAASELADMGAKILAVGDIHGAVYNPDGLDIVDLAVHVENAGTVRGFAGGEPIDGREMLELECDVLVPAAAGNQITAENASRVQARCVAEGANSPTTPEADEMLEDKGIFVIPDILCNAGGVFVSYLEFTQETQQEQMSGKEVKKRLKNRMIGTFHKVLNLAEERSFGMRDAAMCMAVKTVCDAINARGYLQ